MARTPTPGERRVDLDALRSGRVTDGVASAREVAEAHEYARRVMHTDREGNLTTWGARSILLDLLSEVSMGPVQRDKTTRLLERALDDLEDAVRRTHDAFGCDVDAEERGRYACRTCVESTRRAFVEPECEAESEPEPPPERNEPLAQAARRRHDVLRRHDEASTTGTMEWQRLKHELGLCETSDEVAFEEVVHRARAGTRDAQVTRAPDAAKTSRLTDALDIRRGDRLVLTLRAFGEGGLVVDDIIVTRGDRDGG